LSRFLAAQVVVFLLCGVHTARLLQPGSFYEHLWRTRDAAFYLGCLFCAGLLLLLASELLRRLPCSLLTRVFNHLFVLALGAGVFTNLWFYTKRSSGYHIGQFGVEMSTLWLLLMGVVAYSLARPGAKLVLRCRQACAICSPALVIVAVQLLLKPSYPIARDPLPCEETRPVMRASVAAEPARPVYLVLFDEWSYPRSHEDGELLPFFPHLRAFARQAIVFDDAHAQGEETAVSLPGLLFQTDHPAVIKRGEVGFEHQGGFVPSRDCKSIFSVVSGLDYQCGVIAFAMPYRMWLGDQVDYCRSYPWRYRGHDWPGAVAYHTQEILNTWTDPWSRFLREKITSRVPDAYMLRLYREMTRDILDVIRDQPPNTFVICHYPLPHHPYILDVDGSYRGPAFESWDKTDWAGYRRNLAAVDVLAGRFIAAMKQSDKFDDALVIFTSDHSWREDPGRRTGRISDALSHVPLMIKLPKQQRPLSVASRFEHRQLGALIAHALRMGGDPIDLARALKLDVGGGRPGGDAGTPVARR
jgi:hypothetical protein